MSRAVSLPGRTFNVEAGSFGGFCTVFAMSAPIGPRYSASTPPRSSCAYVAARSGFRKTVPGSGGAPSGRYSERVDGNAANLAALFAICVWNVGSTTNPLRARFSAGFRVFASDRVPHLRSASDHVAGVPGTPTLSPLVTASLNGSGWPFSTKRFASADFGAVSRPSKVWTRPVLAS